MKKYKVKNISCSNCAKTIKNGFSDYDVKVNVNTSEVIFEDNIDEKYVTKHLKEIGYPIIEIEDNSMKTKLIISVIFTIPLVIGMFNHFDFSKAFIPDFFSNMYLQLALASVVQFYVGMKFYVSAFNSLRQKVLGMDILVVIATTSAFVFSVYTMFTSTEEMMLLYFETSALIITIVLAGNFIEHKIKSRTNDTISKLVDLSVKEAIVLKDDIEVKLPIEDVMLNDVVVVYANEKIPMDGEIITGETYVNEASFTGEGLPVKKLIGEEVIGGSINLSQKINILVTKELEENLLSQIVLAVEEASLVETKYQKIADKIAGYFVPFVLVIALITFILNSVITANYEQAMLNALSVLLISCPCALGLATPTAIINANSVSAKRGILYKGGNFFELAHKIDVICFDKTGTLTKGTPEVINYEISSEYDNIIYSISKHSNHPVSIAAMNYLNATEIELEVKHVDGLGLEAISNNDTYFIGNYKIKEGLEKRENTCNYVLKNNELIGFYEVEDQIKESSDALIKELKILGIESILITGDNTLVANKIASKLGIDRVYAEVLPINKSEIVNELKGENKVVAFVGDGVNDSVAISSADIGISVKNGNDIAIQASDVTLMNDNLLTIVDGINISKRTYNNIRQNLFWAFSYNIIAIPLAASGHLNMYVAAIAMGFSSIVVVCNALRIRNIKFRTNKVVIEDVNINCDKCVAKISQLLISNGINKFVVNKEYKTIEVELNDLENAKIILSKNNYIKE